MPVLNAVTSRFKRTGIDDDILKTGVIVTADTGFSNYFKGRLSDCRDCALKHDCMNNPESANNSKGHGRQVSFRDESTPAPRYTDWMKRRVDSKEGKLIYSHQMSVVEPVFGNTGTNKGLNRFSLRGKAKVQLQ